MGTIYVGPDKRPVTVSDNFFSKSTAEQQQIVNDISGKLTQPQQQPTVGVGEDVARAIPSGIKRGAEGLVGTPEDTGSLGGSAIQKIAGWLGFQPEQAKAAGGGVSTAISGALNPIGAVSKVVRDVGGPDLTHLYAPTSESVKQDVEAAVPAAKSVNYAPQTRLGKFAHTGAEFATGAVAGETRLPAILRRVGQQLGIGALSEGAGQVTEGTGYEPWARVGAGLLGGGLLSGAVRKGPPTPQATRTMERGIPLTAGQATGNKGLQIAESELGGGTARALGDRQRERLTSRAMADVGEPAGSLATPEHMTRANARIGGELDRIEGAVGDVPITPQHQQAMLDAIERYNGLVGPNNRAPIVGQTVSGIGSLMRANGAPTLNGEQLAELRTNLRGAMQNADGQTLEALQAIQGQVDEAIGTHLAATNPQLAEDWATARRQYRLYLDMERAVANEPAAVAGQGVVTPGSLRGGVKGVEGNRRLVQGASEFSGLANDAAVAMPPLQDSSTAARGAVRAATSGVALGTALGHPVASMAGALAPFGASKVLMSPPVQRLLMSAPEDARAALTALIAAHQARPGAGG